MSFKDMYDAQVDFEKNFFDPTTLTLEDRIKWVKEFCLCTHDELSEILKELPWKEFHKYDKLYNPQKPKEEAIDALKYVLNICIALGMTSEEVKSMFYEKSALVAQRLQHAKQAK